MANQPRIALVLVKDLFFQTRLASGLNGLGLTPVFLRTEAEIGQAAPAAHLAIIDLAARHIDPWDTIRRVRSERPALPVLAFGSHLDLDARQRALAAGADRVVANSALATDLPNLVQRLLRA